jgi:hypothetical protein
LEGGVMAENVTAEEIAQLVEFCRNERDAREFSRVENDYVTTARSALAIAEKLPALLAAAEEATAITEFALHTNWELSHKHPYYGDDDDDEVCWIVNEVVGGINDREWNAIGKGATPAEAMADAIRALIEKEN